MKNKKVFWSFGVIFFVFGILYWLGIVGFWVDDVKGYFSERQSARYFQELEEKSAELERLYKEDTYGGDTPEETWALFVDALEKGDTDLASKYFVVEKQDEMKKAFVAGKENGANIHFLEIVAKIDSGGYYPNDNTKFRYVVVGTENEWKGVVEFTYDLVLNKETNKWKILDL